ncbi:endoplasmic reticulum lectin 1-like isoform X2 [Anneissia japonica]|uniref:endoplasmic reticulum lectin 1-like isoform X2 n=1 Tax=Anneissia japonica TaxID=1529436 RepID=UPI0014257594|nr:endoplasmic reticulum lectin 1-like isoform X2 [Anneissia japonica]
MMVIMSVLELVSLTILTQMSIGAGDFFNDDALFRLKWVDKVEEFSEENSVVMTTAENEQYRCFLPDSGSEEKKKTAYTGPSAKIVLKPLFKSKACVLKLEPYWTYELCHGKFLRQYHEEKLPGNNVKLLEYYLGYYEAPSVVPSPSDLIPTKKIDGKDIPYYEVLMSNGTLCDIKDKKARVTRLRYICDLQGRNEMVSLEEVSTCEYEGLVLTPALCSHPSYKVKDMPESNINCQPLTGSPVYPSGYQRLNSADTQNQYSPVKPKPVSQPRSSSQPTPKVSPVPIHPVDTSVVESFLKGEYCLNGGGREWWKYTFCYGKYVQQYHEEKGGVRSSTINLGTWNEDIHIKWYHSPERLRTTSLTTISQFYGNGDICDVTGKARQVLVKLKCKETLRLPAVSLSLHEPKTCDYILLIESSIFCSLISTVDAHGLINFSP